MSQNTFYEFYYIIKCVLIIIKIKWKIHFQAIFVLKGQNKSKDKLAQSENDPFPLVSGQHYHLKSFIIYLSFGVMEQWLNFSAQFVSNSIKQTGQRKLETCVIFP